MLVYLGGAGGLLDGGINGAFALVVVNPPKSRSVLLLSYELL